MDDLFRKYGGRGPRYTSYPTADRFRDDFDAVAYRHWLGRRNFAGRKRRLGLYVHVPFCDTLCFYCGCNKISTKDHSKGTRYTDYLLREARMVSEAVAGGREVAKMHWGGGTPSFLDEEDSARLVEGLRQLFDFDPKGEYAIEIDPRRAGPERIRQLAGLGFNRLSIGVQDFDPEVQRAVNRIQSLEQTRAVIDAGRAHGMGSVNLDLILGLPKQTLEGFAATVENVIACDPDRIALYAYAHLPNMFSPQKRIIEADLPSSGLKYELMRRAVERLGEAGYVHIGMDHFAKPTDELAVAQRHGTLIRDFQGYSSGGDCDLIGLGASSIGKVGPSYSQNTKSLDGYYGAIDAGELPIARGLVLNADDLARRAVIQALSCQFTLSRESISVAHLIDFDSYFAPELADLEALADDGLVELEGDWITVTQQGRALVRSVCMVFDKYLRLTQERTRYSRVM